MSSLRLRLSAAASVVPEAAAFVVLPLPASSRLASFALSSGSRRWASSTEWEEEEITALEVVAAEVGMGSSGSRGFSCFWCWRRRERRSEVDTGDDVGVADRSEKSG